MLKIRLRRMGAIRQPHYRIVVADATSPRDGAFIEILGHYNPRTDPPTVQVDVEKYNDWKRKGAQPTDAVAKVVQIFNEGRFTPVGQPAKTRKHVAAPAPAPEPEAAPAAAPEAAAEVAEAEAPAAPAAKAKASKAEARAAAAEPTEAAEAAPEAAPAEADMSEAQAEAADEATAPVMEAATETPEAEDAADTDTAV
jgi:small subunit ribosomal protein S16